MLVLTRKSQQNIRIGDEITVTILKVKGNAVSVGIDAPRNVRVVRGELTPLIASHVDAEESCEEADTDGSNGPTHSRSSGDSSSGEDEMHLALATSPNMAPTSRNSLSEFVAHYQKMAKSRKSGRYCQAS
jgi:carbon storage regulator CsrA